MGVAGVASVKRKRLVKLELVEIENYRAVEELQLPLHPTLTVLHGDNAHGKTSVLSAIAVGLGRIPAMLPGVAGVDFRRTDRRRSGPMRVVVTTTEGVAWERLRTFGHIARRRIPRRSLKEMIGAITHADMEKSDPIDLPIVAFYDTDRAVFDVPQRRRGFKPDFPRYAALEGALAARTNFREFFQWFYAMENEELRAQRQKRNPRYTLSELNAVRDAITAMVPGVSEPRIEFRPLRFVVSVESEAGKREELALEQLSGGYRIMLALVADLARRMAQGNPHLEAPLSCEAIVLIDEVELHLHPSWQQRVLADLTRTFPNTQFIVSTHSPQVLTTLHPEQIVQLSRENGRIVAGRAPEPTYGAEAGDVLNVVMGVDERPPNEFTQTLKRYMRLIGDDQGESREAKKLRRELERLSPHDPALATADLEIRRRKLFARMGTSK